MKKPIVRLLAAALLLAGAGSALAGVHYVDVNSTNATPPYTNWTTAAWNIQAAVNAAVAGDEVVVTNGTYSPVVVTNWLNVRSVNGPQFTTINGGGYARCAYLAGASLSGFTLKNGFADYTQGFLHQYSEGYGGGAYGGTLNNCILTSNRVETPSAYNYASETYYYSDAYGGGAAYCELNNCTLTGNSVQAPFIYVRYYYDEDGGGAYGGGAYECTLNNCTLTGNLAEMPLFGSVDRDSNLYTYFGGAYGGGACNCELNNCTLIGNRALGYSGYDTFTHTPFQILGSGDGAYGCDLFNCIAYYYSGSLERCSLVNCWTADPLFVDPYAGNLRLQSNSPCINAGDNSYVTTATDLDGNPRISGGVVDIGAYEFQFNHPPLALATVSPLFAIPQGGTNRFILSPNNAAATVVLDGSQSSDADNDPLTYLWLSTINSQPSTPFATGALATNQFAVGPHTVRLVVSDGHDTATAQVSFEVITPATAVGQLMAVVDEANLGSRNQQPLLATLSSALSAFEHGNPTAALNQLSAFQNQVRAQVAPWNTTLAGEFTAASQKLSDVVSGR